MLIKSWEILDWIRLKTAVKISRRNINNLRYADDTTLMAESKEELKSLLTKVKERVGLKPNIRKTKVMASPPNTSRQMVKQWKQWETLFLWAPNHCRWWLQPWIKRHLLLGRKVMINLDSILKSRDIILPTKVHLVKGMVFPVVIYGC